MEPAHPSANLPEPPDDASSLGRPASGGPWLADLGSLIRAGKLSGKVLAGLSLTRMDDPGGSWLDPLFQGPAPIAELRGLGERYTQLQYLGEGAEGMVFKALDTLLQRWVALKVLKANSDLALSEARAQAQVEHPNVCRVYEVGRGFIVMQLVEGGTLADLGGTLDLRSRIACLRDIAHGVQAAHQRGLLHLDLKLGNILLHRNADGTCTPVVGDFGMVLDRANPDPEACPMGTPPYSSPEQLAGDPKGVLPESDVYALGVLAYTLLSGHAPFQAISLEGLLSDMILAPPIRLAQVSPGLPGDLVRAVHKCMEKDPRRRYASAGELAEEFERFLQCRPLNVMGRSIPYRVLRCFQRNRRTTGALGLGLAALGLSVGLSVWREAHIAQRTDWDRHFQKKVEEVRVDLERAFRRPLHDIRPDLARVQEVIDAIRMEMNRHRQLAVGPAHLALGQLLLIQDPSSSEAARQFQTAWDSGLHTEGARTWLAFALLRQYEEARMEAHRQLVAGGVVEREALRARYLEPVRLMLKGKGDSDQARLAHMADVIEAQLNFSQDRPKLQATLLALAIEYRRRAPQDLDALIEEIDARSRQLEGWLANGRASPDPAIVAARWKDYNERIQEGLALAPSYPGIYNRCVKACQLRLDHPRLDPTPPAVILEAFHAWVDRGLRLSPDDSDLQVSRIELVSREVLDQGKSAKAAHGEMRQILAETRQAKAPVLYAILSHVIRGTMRDRDFLPFGLGVLTSAPLPKDSQDWFFDLFAMMVSSVNQGQDPGPFLDLLGPRAKGWQEWTVGMIHADWLAATGATEAVDLKSLNDLQVRLDPSLFRAAVLELPWASMCCRIRGSAQDWLALERGFQLLDWQNQPEESLPAIMGSWLDAGMALAEHAHAEHKDASTYLEGMASRLSQLVVSDRPSRLRRSLFEARLQLCAAKVDAASSEDVQGAVAKVGEILGHFGSQLPFAELTWTSRILPGRGPLLRLRAELRMEAARRLSGPARRQEARRAKVDFSEAVAPCPAFHRVLAPRIREAERLEHLHF